MDNLIADIARVRDTSDGAKCERPPLRTETEFLKREIPALLELCHRQPLIEIGALTLEKLLWAASKSLMQDDLLAMIEGRHERFEINRPLRRLWLTDNHTDNVVGSFESLDACYDAAREIMRGEKEGEG